MISLLSTERVWLMEPSAYLQLAALVRPADIPAEVPSAVTPGIQIEDGLATVSIKGTMMRQAPAILRRVMSTCGVDFCETAALVKDLRALREDPSVKAVLLDIDSPGGTVNGTPELAAAIRGLSREKYVYAYTSGLACSAAYWAAAQCDGIYAAPSARVGSIGVLMPMIDSSAAYAEAGLRVEVFAAGKYKSTGVSGTSLSDEQRELLQQQVDDTWAQFKEEVVRRRKGVDAANMEGQTFTGTAARRNGLVDACCNSLEELQAKLRTRHCMA